MSTQAGNRVSICTTAQNTPLANAAAAVALTYVLVGGTGRIGSFGNNENILSYNHLSTATVQKSKGVSDLGNPEIEVERDMGDAGQDALRTAGASKNNQYVIMIERNDAPTGASPKPTRHYLRGPITGPVMPGGGVEDFDLQVFTMAANQFFEVDPSAT